MRIALVLGVMGRFIRLFALAFLPPAGMALWDGDGPAALHFLGALAITACLGALLARHTSRGAVFLRAEALAIVAGTWMTISWLGALPYVLEGLGPLDAWFESMSGFTTTGATILTDFSTHGRAFYLWRGLTQWLGGFGVIGLFVIVLPHLGIGGRQLFFAEASSVSGEALSPQMRRTARRLWSLYVGMTGAQVVTLAAAGLPLYDAVVNALATLSAGGFCPEARSVEAYGSAAVEWAFVPFMFLSGASFTLQWRALRGEPGRLFGDGEFRAYALVTLGATGAIAVLLAAGVPGEREIRAAAFQVTSLISSNGFASEDYALWSPGAGAILVAVSVICACAGSAGGGPKVVRLLIVGRFLRRELTQAVHPHAVIPLTHKRRPVSSQNLRAVVAVVILFFGGYLVVTLLLAVSGVGLVEAFTGAVACMNNVGPGLGSVGPMGSYADLGAPAKVILILAMWLGRLEILTVVAILHPEAWRGTRWGGAPQRRAGGAREGLPTPLLPSGDAPAPAAPPADRTPGGAPGPR